MKLDLDFTRAQFMAFEELSLNGQSFFENAGGSYTCRQVYDRLTRFYRERKVQPYSAYAASALGGAEMDEARAGLSAMMGIDADEVSFGPSTTQNTYVLAQAFAQHLQPGDVVIVTNQDHEANTGPWRRLAERGMVIREWQMNESGHLDTADLAEMLDDKVRLVCFPHCSNVVGEINDVAAITAMVHSAGAVTCVDGVSYAPHGIPNVGQLGADIYLFSAYKTYGPHQGIMAIRRDLGMALPNQGHYFNAGSLYKRFTPAGPDHAQIAASAGMVDYANALYAHHFTATTDQAGRAAKVHDLMRSAEIAVMQPLLDYLAAKNSIRLLGPTDAAKRAPTLALDIGRAAEPVAAALAPYGVMAGGGDFYANRALTAQGIDPVVGVLRVSFVHYTSPAEITQLIDALDHVL